MTAIDDLEQLNLVARYRNRLDDIRTWYSELPDLILAIGSQALDLTGIRGTTDRIPGGDALAMLGPWAPDADHGDDLPHPIQICREWVDTINGQPLPTFTQNWRWLRDHTPRILESQWATAWRQDIDNLWGRLSALTGHNDPKPPPEPINLHTMALDIPDDARLTPTEAGHFFPGITEKIKDDKHHRRLTITPDEKGRYTAADLKHYAASRGCISPLTMAT